MRALLLFILGVFVACAPSVAVPVETAREPILNGTAAASANQVFLLDLRFNTGSASICTGVLISPRVLLTAAHCVDPAFHGALSVTVRATNEPDDTMLMNSDMIPVTVISRHPSWNAAQTESDFDLAALLLSTPPLIATTPAPMGSAPASGTQVNIVGYGRLTAGSSASSGTRRSLSVNVNSTTAATFNFGSGSAGLCVGDSGGPSFVNGAVVGIHSRAVGGTCGEGVDIRVDTLRSFIDAFVTANDAALCTMDARCATGCPSPDPDCPCAADGTCNSTCGASDPDCRCVANGLCGASCGAMDPDCCGADSSCDTACGTADPDCRCLANGMCGATCGTSDPDCCGSDSSCDAACGAADPDCRCRADSTCDMTCGASGANDPDCPCGLNSTCNATCGASDPDCRCRADGRCDPSCTPTDVDCSNCDTDGACEASCGLSDGDCLDDGQVCTEAALCWGGLCESDPRGFTFCTRACSDDSTCANDTTCQSSVCRARPKPPPDDVKGGCSAAPGSLVLLLLSLLFRRQR